MLFEGNTKGKRKVKKKRLLWENLSTITTFQRKRMWFLSSTSFFPSAFSKDIKELKAIKKKSTQEVVKEGGLFRCKYDKYISCLHRRLLFRVRQMHFYSDYTQHWFFLFLFDFRLFGGWKTNLSLKTSFFKLKAYDLWVLLSPQVFI